MNVSPSTGKTLMAGAFGRTMLLVLSMSENVEELRVRITTPTLVGDRIPIGAQLHAIRAAVGRITESRRNAREIIADSIPPAR